MNWLDFALVALLAACILQGVFKGFVRTGIDFILMLAGLFCGLWFYHPLSFLLRPYLRPKELAEGISFLAILTLFTLAGVVVQLGLSRLIKAGNLGWLDRVLGGGFGIVRGVFMATVAILVVMAVAPKPLPGTVLDSRIAPSLVDGARYAASVAPDEVRFGFRQACKDIERVVPPSWQKSVARLQVI